MTASDITKEGAVGAPYPMGSGALYSNRIMPCGPAPVLSESAAGETNSIPPNGEDGQSGTQKRKHTPCNPLVYKAMRLLEEHGYNADRIVSRNGWQISIIATKGREELRIAVIHSRKPVPDAKTLHSLFPDKVEPLCGYVKPGLYKTMIWVNSPLIGWRYYMVEPGGLSRDWDFAKLMEE